MVTNIKIMLQQEEEKIMTLRDGQMICQVHLQIRAKLHNTHLLVHQTNL